ncbi:MAG TPA: hypothetical protein VN023_08455 [Methylovorus sp.]|nr:hypothetical protein [Methylovorus sp.]
MSARTPFSRYAIWLALALTLGATAWTSISEPEAEVAVAAPKVNKASQPATPAKVAADRQVFASGSRGEEAADDDALDIRKLSQRTSDEPIPNLFNLEMPEPPASAQAAEAPPVPQTPALPFTYAGKLVNNGQLTVFLSKGALNYTVREGDVIGKWQVKRMEPPQMIMSYRPLNTEVPMMIGDIN